MSVQGFAIVILDFTSDAWTMAVTAVGTALTLYLGLKVERKRLKRIQADEESERMRQLLNVQFSHTPFTVNEIREQLPRFDPPEDHPSLFNYPGLIDYPETDNVIPFPGMTVDNPGPSAHFVADSFGMHPSNGMMDRNWEAVVGEEDKTLEPEQEMCKHCYRLIKGAVHAEGMNRGKMRCDPDDSLMKYGYNAEPIDSECGQTCLGHK